ncbi:MAG: hypothetical protein EOO65_01025, partial [Methanosarcinales archaeon]
MTTTNHERLLTVAFLAGIAATTATMTSFVSARLEKPTKLREPAGVATLRHGGEVHTWVADTHNNRVLHVSEAGDVVGVIGTGAFDFFGDGGDAAHAKLAWPHGVAARATSRAAAEHAQASIALYIADTFNHRVRRVVDGRIETVAGNGKRGFRGDGGAATSARLSHPHAVALLPAPDSGHEDTIVSPAPTGKLVSPATSYSIWIADTYNNRIRRVDANGVITTVVGTGAPAFAGDNGAALDASLAWPMGLAVMPSARAPNSVVLLIADTYNHRVRAVSSAGIITTLAGDGKEGTNQDGPDACQESLSHPFGIAAVRAEMGQDEFVVWFTDSSRHKLRQIGPNSALRTLAGAVWPGYYGDGGPADEAQMNEPKGLALVQGAQLNGREQTFEDNDAVNLLIADSYNNAVRRVKTRERQGNERTHAENNDPSGNHNTVRRLSNADNTATPTMSFTHTPTPTASVSFTHTPTPTASVSFTHTP